MLIRYLYYSYFILLSFSYSFEESFNTEIGQCHLKIENSKYDLGLKRKIKLSAEILTKNFGPVSKNIYYINIINNKKEVKRFPDWASGIAIRNKVFILRNKLSDVIVNHELCHIYQHKIKNSNTLPSWFKEGMAMHFSKDFFNQEAITLSESILLDYVIELDQLHNISKLKDIKNIKVAYQESLYAYQKIISDYSSTAIKNIFLQMNNNIPFDIAFKNILGIELNNFELQIDEKIKESTFTSILFNLPSILIFISSIIITIIFIYIRVRNKRTIKRWEIEEKLELLDEDNNSNDNN